MFFCVYKLDACDLADEIFTYHHLYPQPHTSLVSNDAGGCYMAPQEYTYYNGLAAYIIFLDTKAS